MAQTNSQKNIKDFVKNWKKDAQLSFLVSLLKKHPRARAYLVGGMVRDLALGKKTKDYDLVITGIPLEKLGKILGKLGKVNLVGKNFGVFKFMPHGKKLSLEIDIALPRTERSFQTGAYRGVKVKSSHLLPIEKDLERRDFTINAMALELELRITNYELRIQLPHTPLLIIRPRAHDRGVRGEKERGYLIDPFDGMKDLEKKIIRSVGKPQERFKEDYSRMLRALRFSVQLGFDIEKNTWNALVKNTKKINKKNLPAAGYQLPANEYIVPREVIAKELIKMFASDPIKSVEILDKSGMIKLLMPELIKMKKCPQPRKFHAEGDVWAHTVLALKMLCSKAFSKEFINITAKLKNYELRITNYKKNAIRNPQSAISNELIWALLFHDLGKPYTIKYAERIRFDGHDAKSAQLWREISDRLKLASAGIDAEKTEKLIAKHMFLTNAKLESVKETTLEKYFFSGLFPGRELLMLMFADVSATIPPSGKPDYKNYKKLQRRLIQLEKKILTWQKKKVKDPLDGHEIMKILKLKPGKKVGEIKEFLREMQLKGKVKTKEEAKKIIKEIQ